MDDATGRPRRMRDSFETRCRAVAAMLTSVSPGAAAGWSARAAIAGGGAMRRRAGWGSGIARPPRSGSPGA